MEEQKNVFDHPQVPLEVMEELVPLPPAPDPDPETIEDAIRSAALELNLGETDGSVGLMLMDLGVFISNLDPVKSQGLLDELKTFEDKFGVTVEVKPLNLRPNPAARRGN